MCIFRPLQTNIRDSFSSKGSFRAEGGRQKQRSVDFDQAATGGLPGAAWFFELPGAESGCPGFFFDLNFFVV
jgi:hypothetical protein